MKSVLISIQPKWVEKIASGEKTIEVRKSRPKLETPFKCYIYETIERVKESIKEYDSNFKLLRRKRTTKQWGGKVIGESVCDRIDNYIYKGKDNKLYWRFPDTKDIERVKKESCLTIGEIIDYTGDSDNCYFWHITDLKIYDKPKELSEFFARCNIPESKCKLCDNCYDREDYYGRHYAVKKLIRPPQSWFYVEELQNG